MFLTATLRKGRAINMGNKGRLPRVVVIGGGTGLSVLLRGLKKYPVDITAIVTVADDGGSSGRIRSELKMPPPGDIRNVLVALSDVEPLLEELMQHRFKGEGQLSGHSLGNLMLSAMNDITGNFSHAIREMSRVLNVRGKVLPAANRATVLHAEYTDGTEQTGESLITEKGRGKRIKKVSLRPEKVAALPEALSALRKADLIVLGPGSLYTSVLPNLLVPKIGEGVLRSKAKKVYVCNVMMQPGETISYTASDHVDALHEHLGTSFIDSIVVNDELVPEELMEKYAEESAKPVIFEEEKLKEQGLQIIHDRILTFEDGTIKHDTKKLAELLYTILKQGKV